MSSSLLRLLISCPDRPGIVSAVSRGSCSRPARTSCARTSSRPTPEGGAFFLRMEFTLPGAEPRPARRAVRPRGGGAVPDESGGCGTRGSRSAWRSWCRATTTACSSCLWRWRRGELVAEVVMVVSNHPDLQREVEGFGLPYRHIPGHARHEARGGGGAARASRSALRPGGARALHAGLHAGVPRARARTADQHPPLVPAGVPGTRAVRPCQGAGREADRGHRPLRHGRPSTPARSSSRTRSASTTATTSSC